MYSTNSKLSTIIFIGRPVAAKGLGDLLDALAMLCSYKWSLTIVGGIIEDEILKKRLLKCPNRSIHVFGPVPNSSICKLLNQHDIVVIPSRYENFGQVALESMACAKAIIASRTGGLKELISDGRNGLHFTTADSQDLASKIKLLLDNPSLIEILGGYALEDIQNYSWPIIAQKTLHLLEDLSNDIS